MEFLLYSLALVVLAVAWYVYSSFFVFNPFDATYLLSVTRSLKEEAQWNYVHIRSILQTPLSDLITGAKLDIRYSVYLVSFSLFVVYFLRYIRHLVVRNERKPHPLFIDGKVITESVSCNPDGREFYSIDQSVSTITDIRNRFSKFGDRSALFSGGKWMSYDSMLYLSETLGKIVQTHSRTSAPLCVVGDFSAVKCSAILGLASIGRSVVFVPCDSDSAEIANIIEEQHCEVLMMKRSRLPQLENALDTSLCSSLRVVIFTECNYVEKIELGDLMRCEETLVQEYNVELVSLNHLIETDHRVDEVTKTLPTSPELEDSPAVIVYNSNKEPIQLTHRNLVAAASALVQEYQLTEEDVVLAEPVSVASTISLFLACMLCGARFSITDKIMTICGEVQPTVISASNTTYFNIYKELVCVYKKHVLSRILLAPLRYLFRNTHYFRVVRQRRVAQLLGDNLRLCLSFYSYRPLSNAGHQLLEKMIGVPVSLIFGNTETCGVCTHSVEGKPRIGLTYVAVPFLCNSLRKSDRSSLLISGSNIADSSRMTVVDGTRWFDSGISVRFVKNYILHKMPTTYDSVMPS
ncbi:hypothetical protein WA538_004509 [Blastocystis sp. DL]